MEHFGGPETDGLKILRFAEDYRFRYVAQYLSNYKNEISWHEVLGWNGIVLNLYTLDAAIDALQVHLLTKDIDYYGTIKVWP